MTRCAWLLVASIALFASRSDAQSFPLTISCNDMSGRAVAAVQVTNGIFAKAAIDQGGRPVIEYDPRKITGISGQQQLFVYAHECGHHVLGHVRGGEPPTPAQEQEADCYGIRALINKVGFTAHDVEILQEDMQHLASGDARRLPWRTRAYDLQGCLAGESSARNTALGGGAPAVAAPRPDDCVLHRDADNAIINESRDRKTIDGLYVVANKCTRDMACTFTIETGTLPEGDFDAEIWSRFKVQKTRTEQHALKAGADEEFRFHESIDDVAAGEAIDFRVLKSCR